MYAKKYIIALTIKGFLFLLSCVYAIRTMPIRETAERKYISTDFSKWF